MNKISREKKVYPFSIWVTWFFLAGSILILVYTYYRAEISYNGLQSARYFKFYVVGMLGIFFWGILLGLREEIRVNVLTATTSLIIGLYMVEGALNFLSSSRAATAAKLGVEFDERTQLEVIESLIAEGVDAVPPVFP
jgi:hypothetical protein